MSIFYYEGKAKFQVGNAFYRPQTQVVRDLGLLAASIYRADNGNLRVLDAMSGCGVRSLRYWLEANADYLWVNEANSELAPTLQQNLQATIEAGCCQLTHQDANRIFFDCYSRQDYYDFVDLDAFGSASPYLNTVLWATKIDGLIYLTSTDGKTATGHLPENSLKVYGAYARAHPASQEQGLRLLIGRIQQQAATMHLGIQPIFSLFTGSTYRVMLRLLSHQCLTESNYGFLGYCHHCGDYQTVAWRKLSKAICSHDRYPLTLSGPLWLGSLHSQSELKRLQSLAQQWDWRERVKLLEIMAAEANFPPYYYTLGEIGRRGKMDIPKREQLMEALQEQGYQVSLTHINAQAIKTNADLATCIRIGRNKKST